jgi:Lysine methyltransferase
MNGPSRDEEWREYNVQDQEEDGETSAAGFFGLPENEVWQDFEFIVTPSRVLKLTFQEEYSQSTGMSIWKGSQVLAEYLKQNPEVVQDKSVLELGAGVGLVGLTAYYLGASRTQCSDGDVKVLDNLKSNVNRNLNDEASAVVAPSCTQLIWGKNLDQYREDHGGRHQVILGTDLFYITKSLDPLFQTVHELLTDDGCFVAVMACSAQSPISTVFDFAQKYGFQWTTRSLAPAKPGQTISVGEKDNDETIYTFRRRTIISTVAGDNPSSTTP